MDNDERKKIREIMSKKDESRVDWMYKPSQPDTNDYLLGKKIDKHIEKVPEPTQEEKIGAAFSERIKANIELDMAAKMREDPLFQIRKREDEARRRILDNPVKMKQIQKMINDKKDHQKSKRKKSKKEKKSRSRDSDSDQSGDDLMNTYLNIINKKHQDKSDGDKRHHQDDRKRSGYGLQKHNRDRDEQHSYHRDHHSKPFQHQHESSRNSNSSERTSKYSSSSRGKSSNSQSYHRQSNYRRRSRSQSPRHSRSRSPRHSGSRSPRGRGKLNETEREKKLREMMDNAKWREEVRQKNVKRYEEECAEDEKNAQKGNSADFLNPMMSQHAAQSSVEERIRRNKYNIQRTKMQLNSNFTRR